MIIDKEICICAAMRDNDGYIWRGHRHADCISLMMENGRSYSGVKNQGFITSKNRFVTREAGLRLQIEAGIESKGGGYRSDRLFSEDLY